MLVGCARVQVPGPRTPPPPCAKVAAGAASDAEEDRGRDTGGGEEAADAAGAEAGSWVAPCLPCGPVGPGPFPGAAVSGDLVHRLGSGRDAGHGPWSRTDSDLGLDVATGPRPVVAGSRARVRLAHDDRPPRPSRTPRRTTMPAGAGPRQAAPVPRAAVPRRDSRDPPRRRRPGGRSGSATRSSGASSIARPRSRPSTWRASWSRSSRTSTRAPRALPAESRNALDGSDQGRPAGGPGGFAPRVVALRHHRLRVDRRAGRPDVSRRGRARQGPQGRGRGGPERPLADGEHGRATVLVPPARDVRAGADQRLGRDHGRGGVLPAARRDRPRGARRPAHSPGCLVAAASASRSSSCTAS